MNTPQDILSTRWFRSSPGLLAIQSSEINAEEGIIPNVVMVEEGPAKGHGVNLDADFIAAITAYDQKHYANIGLKARFGHPSASSETMGTQLGVFSNFRTRKVNGKMQEIADLKVLDSANLSPTHPGMKDWVLQMAQEKPDFIMSSIVFKPSGYYQKKGNGQKYKVWAYDEDGHWITEDSDRLVFVDFNEEAGAEHLYTDLVESGAATENLFSTTVNQQLYVAQVDEFLDTHPHIRQFLRDNPDAVGRWMQRAGYSISTNSTHKKMSKFSLKSWLFGETEDDEVIPTAAEMFELRTALNEARTEIAALRTERDEFRNKYEAADLLSKQLTEDARMLRSQVDSLVAEVSQLAARLNTVEQSPAAEPTGGDTPPVEKGYGNGDADNKARQLANRKRIPSPRV